MGRENVEKARPRSVTRPGKGWLLDDTGYLPFKSRAHCDKTLFENTTRYFLGAGKLELGLTRRWTMCRPLVRGYTLVWGPYAGLMKCGGQGSCLSTCI